MKIKLIATDLDNTLLRRDKSVSDYTADVFKRCREQGILIACATARPKRAVFQYIDILDKIQFDTMVFHNGALVYCEGKFAAHHGIPHKTTKALAIEFARLGLAVGVEVDDKNYANYDPSVEWPGMQYILTDFSALPDKPADKIIIQKPSKTDIEKIQLAMPSNLYVEMNEGILGLIMNREATKHNAMQFLAEKYKVALAEIATFGDDLNDVEMLRECGIGVAVANALDEVKSVADYICGDCDDDGVARWLEENVL